MKGILLFLLVIAGINSYGQKINGIVTDKSTKLPISGAVVSSSKGKSYTNTIGEFEIPVSGTIDTIKISHQGHKDYVIPINGLGNKLTIELEPFDILLNTVTISTVRDYKRDSLNNRKEYEKEFNYKTPRLRDALMGNSSFSPSALFAGFNRKKNSEYKLRQTLIEDEKEQYINRFFNASIVSSVTDLRGDDLKSFLQRYRPDYGFVKSLSQYDLITYIKNCYKQFKLLK